ncbi:hypothetical protein [Rhizobium sp. BK176]|uniref:hypothetical protein n=1 Tax=Rhizobium sp. BK176 TaxID=2587071 RepID=UPI002167B5CD|nr:hypothetical protein [Rhizobium sp. BK176]MCS4089258.1 hypothetical protein [Rhizobium sp. BK176]
MKAVAWRWLALIGMVAVVTLAGWIITERSRFTADIRANLRSIPLDASCDTNGILIDQGLVNCVDIGGRFRVVHSRVTQVFLLTSATVRPTPFASFTADVDIDRPIDDALIRFSDAVAQAALQQKTSAAR